MKTATLGDDRHPDVVTLPTNRIEQRRYGRWALAYSGKATVIDKVLSHAARDRNPTELLIYLDEFAAKLD